MNKDRFEELATLEAAGLLEGADLAEFNAAVTDAEQKLRTVRACRETATALARTLPTRAVRPDLKSRLFDAIGTPPPRSGTHDFNVPFTFIESSDEGWQQVAVPGASFKLLSTDAKRGYAVAIGKLLPGTRYPEHDHQEGEDVYVLSGDLTINGRRLNAGDFHRAEAGTRHDINYSDEGCTILIVLSIRDLAAQMAVTAN